MDKEFQGALPPASADGSSSQPMANRTAAVPSGGSPAGAGIAESGFTPGQTEEERMAAKRERWRVQKRLQRLAKTAACPGLPPCLPPASVHVGTSSGGLGTVQGNPPGTLSGETGQELGNWTAEEIAEITNELVDALDEHDQGAAVKAATLANLGAALVKEIEEDAAMPMFCKKIFKKCIPKMTAKALNSTGVSSEHKDSGFVSLAVIYYIYSRISNKKRLKELIATAAKTEAKA
jgi:hypothetical protein